MFDRFLITFLSLIIIITAFTFTIANVKILLLTEGEGGDYFDYCRELTSAHSKQPNLNWEPLVSERQSPGNAPKDV